MTSCRPFVSDNKTNKRVIDGQVDLIPTRSSQERKKERKDSKKGKTERKKGKTERKKGKTERKKGKTARKDGKKDSKERRKERQTERQKRKTDRKKKRKASYLFGILLRRPPALLVLIRPKFSPPERWGEPVVVGCKRGSEA